MLINIKMNSWFPILFNWLFYINFNIYFDAQFVTYLTSGIPFKPASVPNCRVPIIL